MAESQEIPREDRGMYLAAAIVGCEKALADAYVRTHGAAQDTPLDTETLIEHIVTDQCDPCFEGFQECRHLLLDVRKK